MEDNIDNTESYEKLAEKVIIQDELHCGSNTFVNIVIGDEDALSAVASIAGVGSATSRLDEDEDRSENSVVCGRNNNNNDDDASLDDGSHGISRSSSLDETSTVTGSDIVALDSLSSSPVPCTFGAAVSPGPSLHLQQTPPSSPQSKRSSQPAASPNLPFVASTSTLPWGARKEKMLFPAGIHIDPDVKPGEFVMRTLFAEFTVLVDKKLEAVMGEPLERPLAKSLQRGEDPVFDQLLSAFGSVAEHCLPSLLRTLFAWYDRQGLEPNPAEQRQKTEGSKGKASESADKTEKDYLHERRDLAVEFIFCLVLVEVLKQLAVHPGHEGLVGFVENLAFKHFKFREGVQSGPNNPNYHIVADLYAEVIGVLAQSRFQSVRKRFTCELKELRAREPNPVTTQSIISLLMGMKFFRIKMVPIEEFEASFQFMQECAQYFLEVKDKDIKHALAGLFVETLVPVAAAVKNEVNVPVLKNFVEMLYPQTLDMATKKKHCLALFPLVTCLLCVSQKIFFLQNWHYFLAMCLSHLKNRDPKMSRVALESLYRLLWVYMIRIKCESNSATQSRLHSIVNSLFPKGSKGVVPRDTPLNIFVKIIQFIAQERLDFAMKEIVCDLLSVGRPVKMILTPERMSIGLRAFLVVADSLQQKEGDPPMPRTVGVLPSGSTLRIKKTFLNKMLSEDTAKSIGIAAYHPFVRKAFGDILRALDVQFGRPLMMTNVQNANKEPDEMITGERKPKIDLFRTCVAAIPRLMPDGTSRHDLLDMLARLTVHLDEELKGLAFQSLQNIIVDFVDWRDDVVNSFVRLLLKDVTDTFPQLLDNGLRMLLQLLTAWKNALTVGAQSTLRKDSLDVHLATLATTASSASAVVSSMNVVRYVEGFALVVLCHCRLQPRRLAVHILKEAKVILKTLASGAIKDDEPAVVDVMDRACSAVVERILAVLPASEKTSLQTASNVDLQWLSERSSAAWTSSSFHESAADGIKMASSSAAPSTSGSGIDAWFLCLARFLERDVLLSKCPSAVAHSWPTVFTRLNALFSVVDPNPINDNRASLLRSSVAPKKPVNERDLYLGLWRNYSLFACRVVPPNSQNLVVRCTSPDLSISSSPDSLPSDRSESRSPNSSSAAAAATTTVSTTAFYKLLVPLIRCESADIRDPVVLALGRINHEAIRDLMDEMVAYIKEAIDRKQENMRRRRRRDTLRAQLARVFELIAEQGTFATSVLDHHHHRDIAAAAVVSMLHPSLVDYIDGARLFLDGAGGSGSSGGGSSDQDKDAASSPLQEIKGHFCRFVCKLIDGFPLDGRTSLLSVELRRNLFNLFSSWSGRFGVSAPTDKRSVTTAAAPNEDSACTDAEMAALQAMSAVACCGPMFDVQQGLAAEDGYVYLWLHALLGCRRADQRVYHLAQETLVLLLEFNPDVGALLEWVVDCCYTGENDVADACFTALVVIFSAREYPCDHYTAIINVTLMNTGCPRANIHEMALQLLQILDKRFFGSTVVPVVDDGGSGRGPAVEDDNGDLDDDDDVNNDVGDRNGNNTLDVLLSTTYSRSQSFLSKQLAQLHPELTMPMFSEITHRFQTARPPVQQILLQYLLPWLYNMELVDPHIQPTNPVSQFLLNTMQEYYPANDSSAAAAAAAGGNLALRKEGWGSAEATEMVLNNLFYLTTKFVDGHPKEIEELWTALSACWPGNLRIILRYLFIVSGMAPNELLASSKRVVLFMGRSRPEILVDELMNELQTVETLNCVIERTETPPFFRVTNVRKTSTHSDTTSGGMPTDVASRCSELPVEEGTIHTKRHSAEDPSAQKENNGGGGSVTKPLSSGHGSLRSTCSISSTGSCKVDGKFMMAPAALGGSVTTDGVQTLGSDMVAEDNFVILRRQGEEKSDTPLPHPLPMPEYGGYFAPLTEFLPNSSQSISGFHRCNLAMMLLTDVVVDGLDVDWSVHVPLMLHIVFLGLDNSRPLVYEHCKKLLLHLLIIMTSHGDHFTIARILLNNMTRRQSFGLQPPSLSIAATGNFTDPEFDLDSIVRSDDPSKSTATTSSSSVLNTTATTTATSCSDSESSSGCGIDGRGHRSRSTSGDTVVTIVMDPLGSLSGTSSPVQVDGPVTTSSRVKTEDVVKALVDFIASRKSLPMWNYEDITARLWSIRSADHLATFLHYVLFVFKDSLPQAHIEERWAQISLQLALSCSSRHYAGRSLQIFRSLGVPVTPRMLSEILSRLVETVAEQGEDMQGYVTEIMLTLEAAVDNLDSDFHPIDFVKELFKSTPNLNKGPNRKNVHSLPASQSYHGHGQPPPGHARSTSYSVTFCTRKQPGGSPTAEIKMPETRNRNSADVDAMMMMTPSRSSNKSTNLSRSRSAQSLKMMADQSTLDDKMAVLSQLFWIGVSLLESDYEYEFLLAMRLLEKVLKRLPLDRPDCREKVDKLHVQLRWTNFPGVHALLLKGLTSPSTYEPTLSLVSRFTLLLDVPVVDPSQSIGFPFNVIALLPYMLQNYEDPNAVCTQSAENIAQVCLGKSKTLENLATVMTLYSRRTFSKESFQWTKCVVKYLFDSYSHHSLAMMAFLVEILEKGPSSAQASILSIVHCMLHYLDLNVAAAQPINADLLRVIAKYVEGPHWKEALKILKLAVTRSSTLVVPPSSSSALSSCSVSSSSSYGFASNYTDTTSLGSHTSFAEAEVFTKKELPGRTMEFSFDLSQTPIIGRRYQVKQQQHQQQQQQQQLQSLSASTTTLAAATTAVSAVTSLSISGGSHSTTSDGKLAAAAKLTAMSSHGGFDASSQRSGSLSQSLTVVEPGAPVSGWRRPWASQARTRECLVNLLTSCGQRVGLPKSPSDNLMNKVIFSQSSDIVDRQSSKYSSTEEVSVVNNDMSLDSKVDDSTTTTDQQFGVFKDFDFLEYELESQEGESLDNFNWGVRRRSLSNLEDVEPTSIQESSLKGSAPNLAVRKEESSDDEMTSTSPVDDARTEELTPSSINLIFHPSSLPILDRSQHHSSPNSGSSHSICSDPDLASDLQANNSHSSHFSNTSGSGGGVVGHVGGYLTNTLSEAEMAWRQHIHALLADSCGYLMPQTFLAFARIFKEIRLKFVSLTQEGCHYLAVLDTPRSVASQFLNMVDVLGGVECPLVYVDHVTVVACNLVERLRFCVLELQEHMDTFAEKRSHTLECLERIKTSLKMEVMNEALTEMNSEDLQLDLCRCLFKVHFQLLLLFDAFYKMVGLLTTAAESSRVNNMTREVMNMRLELIRANEERNVGGSSEDLLSSGQFPQPMDGLESTWHDAEHALLDLLHSRKWSKVMRLFQNCRNLFPTDVSGLNEDEDVDIILSLYCKFLRERQSGVLIITHTDHDLTEVYSHLMDVNVQLSASVRQLERSAARTDRIAGGGEQLASMTSSMEVTVRKTEC